MRIWNAILLHSQPDSFELCLEISQDMGIHLTRSQNLAEFLLALQEDELHFAIFEVDRVIREQLDWLKLIRKMRPKIPLILICDAPAREIEAQLYELGIFYVGIRPVHRGILAEIFLAAIKLSIKNNNHNLII